MEISRATFGPEKDGYAVEHDGETYRFQEDGDTAVYVGEGKIPQAVVDELTKDRVSAVSYSGTISEEIVGYVGEVSGGGGVEVRSDDPSDPSVGDSWFNTTDEVLRVAYDDGGSVGVREVRSVFSEASVRVVEDFEGQTMSNLEALYNVSADQQIAQQNGSDRLEITAAPGEFGGVYWSEQSDEVEATAYIPDENSTVGVNLTDSDGNTEVFILPDLAGAQAPEPSIFLFDQINTQPIDTVAVTPSNFIGGDIELSLRSDGDGNVIGEATDINGDTTTLSGSAPAGLSKEGYGVQGRKVGGSGESKIYIDDVKAFAEGQEVSPALSEYARIDAVPDAYINSGEGVTDNGSGLEVVETEVDHDSLNNYASEEHHPVFVQSSVGGAEQLEDAIWVDISQSPPRIKRWNGSSWESTGAEPSTHDNTAHSTDYATTNHDNTAHSETYALASDVVSDHANLTNVQTDQHHTRPSAGTGITDDSDVFSIDGKLAVDGSSRWSRKERMVYDAGVLGVEGKSISVSDGSTKEYYSHSSRQEVTVSDGTEVYTEFQINGDNDAGVDFGGFKYPIDTGNNNISGGVHVYVRSDGTNVELVYEILNGNGTTVTEQVLDTSTNSTEKWAVSLLIDNLSVAQFVGVETFDVEVRYTRNDLPSDGHNNTDNFSEDISDNPITQDAKRGGFELVSSASGANIDATIRYLELLTA